MISMLIIALSQNGISIEIKQISLPKTLDLTSQNKISILTIELSRNNISLEREYADSIKRISIPRTLDLRSQNMISILMLFCHETALQL